MIRWTWYAFFAAVWSGESMEKEINLTLYVGGTAMSSKRAIQQFREMMENHFKNNYSLEVIDIYENMEAAERENIMAIPTLIKKSPPPKRRLIGSFSDEEKVLRALDLKA
jgi:circadian clock protein KaiB